MANVYKIWDLQRKNKILVSVSDNDPDKYATIILKASEKLQINGSKLCLESDGTIVDDDAIDFVKSEILVLLESDSQWIDINNTASESLPSTITVLSDTNDTNQESQESVSDEIHISYKVDCNIEHMWENLEIPWESLDNEHVIQLQNGHKSKSATTFLVQTIVKKMRSIKKDIPAKAFKLVAKKVTNKYPVFLDQDEDGVLLGDGCHSLASKLLDRHHYLNRPHKQKVISDENENPIKNKKRRLSAKAGCIAWAPTQSEPYETTSKFSETDLQFDELMEKTYSKQRHFLNAAIAPTITAIREEWPILFSTRGIFWYFVRLTDSDIHLLNEISGKEKVIVEYVKNKHKLQSDNDDIKELNALKYIAIHFKDSLDDFYKEFQELSDNDIAELPVTPVIVQIKKNEYSPFTLFIEKEKVLSAETFIEALKVTFAMIFILNLEYPTTLSTTFEFIQRYFLKIHPDAGSKSKLMSATKKKIFNFINGLKNFNV